jgi:predicted esterase
VRLLSKARRPRSLRLTTAAAALAVVAIGLSLPASADDAATGATSPAGAAPAAMPTVVTPYGTDSVGVPLFRVDPGEQLPAVVPSDRPFKAIVTLPTPLGDREYRMFVPAGLSGPAPTLIAMGGYADAGEPERYMRWEQSASAHHFVVLYPRGLNLSFNAGRCCGQASLHGFDDDAFLLQMLQVQRDLYPEDDSRLYLTGFSNGGMMAYRFACEHPSMVAAIGVVAAAYMDSPTCRPTVPVPVMHIHGKLDGTLPWKGTPYSAMLRTSIPTVPQTDAVFGHVDYWANVPVRNVYLPTVGHVWPHLNGAGSYDATGQLTLFLLHFRR